jgi:hypothetical protein
LRIGQQFRFPGLDGKVAGDPFLVETPKVSFITGPELTDCKFCLWRCHYFEIKGRMIIMSNS